MNLYKPTYIQKHVHAYIISPFLIHLADQYQTILFFCNTLVLHHVTRGTQDPPRDTLDHLRGTQYPPRVTQDPPRDTQNATKRTQDPPRNTQDPPKDTEDPRIGTPDPKRHPLPFYRRPVSY